MTATNESGDRPRVLCIDDDPAIVAALTMRLKAYDVDVVTAYFGTQGIWAAITEKPDVIITDVQMPSGNGNFIVECLKERVDTRNIPVIVLTGTRDAETKRALLALGVDAYLQKPTSLAKVIEVVSRHIELRVLQDA